MYAMRAGPPSTTTPMPCSAAAGSVRTTVYHITGTQISQLNSDTLGVSVCGPVNLRRALVAKCIASGLVYCGIVTAAEPLDCPPSLIPSIAMRDVLQEGYHSAYNEAFLGAEKPCEGFLTITRCHLL